MAPENGTGDKRPRGVYLHPNPLGSRTLSWLQWNRCLSRDFKCLPTAAEATTYLASIQYLIRKFYRFLVRILPV